jgi:hypothetical protein
MILKIKLHYNIIMEVDTLFDDSLYVNNIKENTIFFEKKKLLNFLVDEIINDLKLFSGDEII